VRALGTALMETQFAWPEARPALNASPCCVPDCRNTVATELERRALCPDHFVSVSLSEMEARSARLKQAADSLVLSAFKSFLTACGERAQALSQSQTGAAPALQTGLQEILRRCAQLGKNLRRSPRTEARFPVWLRREDPRHTWEEETWTSSVSRHGAGFVCRHSVAVNGVVVLCRRDKGSRAQARVVYSRFDAEGRRHIGVELLDREDFWDPPNHPA
jgi:hypothetical protein